MEIDPRFDSSSRNETYDQEIRAEEELRQAVLNLARSLTGPTPELYFATVRAIGTPLRGTVVEPLRKALREVGYHLEIIKLSEVLERVAKRYGVPVRVSTDRFERYTQLTAAGERVCEAVGRRDALVIEAVRALHEKRRQQARDAANEAGLRGVAYLFRNVMHPHEVERLRKLYGQRLFVISAFSPEQRRRTHLALQLANDDPMRAELMGEAAAKLLLSETGRLSPAEERAGDRAARRFRMDIPATWQHADLFLDASDLGRLDEQITRLVHLIFSHPFRTPRPEEIGMAEAFNAALESANLARQVGAAIISPDQDVLSMGTNDVPRPGGGVYRGGTTIDHRDHTPEWGHDSSDINRRSILRDLIEHLLADPDWLRILDDDLAANDDDSPGAQLADGLKGHAESDRPPLDFERLVDWLIRSDTFRQSQFFDVMEYGRTLHAEMDAITSAAAKTISIRHATLYCTTLPCHECARLIIGAGIKRVIFVEPYDKSRAMVLYRTEIELKTMAESTRDSQDGKVHFIPYVGLAARRFHQLFAHIPRKADDVIPRDEQALDGRTISWDPATAPIRETILSDSALNSTSRFIDQLLHERRTISEFDDWVARHGRAH